MINNKAIELLEENGYGENSPRTSAFSKTLIQTEKPYPFTLVSRVYVFEKKKIDIMVFDLHFQTIPRYMSGLLSLRIKKDFKIPKDTTKSYNYDNISQCIKHIELIAEIIRSALQLYPALTVCIDEMACFCFIRCGYNVEHKIAHLWTHDNVYAENRIGGIKIEDYSFAKAIENHCCFKDKTIEAAIEELKSRKPFQTNKESV